MTAKHLIALTAISIVLAGCAHTAAELAPKKQAAEHRSEAAIKADVLFWDTLHNGEYRKIPKALEALTAVYLNNPNDPVTAAHLGWLHIWRAAERARMEQIPATISDDVVMSHKYFREAVTLDPSDARYLGFLGSAIVAEGTIHKDERLLREGYQTLLDAIQAWPEFNLFTAGYMMSARPAGSDPFQKGLDWEWRNLDECIQEKLDRKNPDYSKYMSLQTTTGVKRVCWNSWIAPHNFEGFFLNMGDMLVKSGDWQTAQKIYANARLSPDYSNWKFRPVLEERIKDAQRNVTLFNAPKGAIMKKERKIMVNSEFACVACHQR